jgi:Phosphomannose isomerase
MNYLSTKLHTIAMSNLYPLKFNPIFKERIWGGTKLSTLLGKKLPTQSKIGESWELSAVDGSISVVTNGFLKDNNLQELIEVYMGDLVGEAVYEKFGTDFPLLIKLIDASDDLSIQVHPNDKLAKERHNSFGKTEMWYVVGCDPESKIYVGFNQEVDKAKYVKYLNENKLADILNVEISQKGDTFFIPSGRIHAIGKGNLIAEIQQTSDITYRMYDWGRVDDNGNPRELHTDLAVDAIDYNVYPSYKTDYKAQTNQSNNLVDCPYFTTNLIKLEAGKGLETDYSLLDSFIILMVLQGSIDITSPTGKETGKLGETILIPASLEQITISTTTGAEVLEVYIKN